MFCSLSTLRRSMVVGVCVSACVLAGCSGEESGDRTTAEAAQATQEQVPEELDQPTRRGAIEFTQHWIKSLNRASNSGDTEDLRDLFQTDCTACLNLAAGIEDLYQGGGSMTTKGWEVLRARATLRPAGASGGRVTGAVVRLQVRRGSETVHQGAAGEAEVFTGGKRRYRVHLVRVEGAWSVRAFS